MGFIRRNVLFLTWLIAVVATLGSLYLSEVRGFIPCELCWFQRILMYPLSIILGVAAFYDEHSVKKYVLPLSIIGMLVSSYHYMEQKIPGFAEIKPCTQGVPCSTQYMNWFGFITIPFLALTAFTLITVLLVVFRKK